MYYGHNSPLAMSGHVGNKFRFDEDIKNSAFVYLTGKFVPVHTIKSYLGVAV